MTPPITGFGVLVESTRLNRHAHYRRPCRFFKIGGNKNGKNLSAPAQTAPPDVKKYTTLEFEAITGIPRGTLQRWACEDTFIPAEKSNRRGKPNYYLESQIPEALTKHKGDKHATAKTPTTSNAPHSDNPTDDNDDNARTSSPSCAGSGLPESITTLTPLDKIQAHVDEAADYDREDDSAIPEAETASAPMTIETLCTIVTLEDRANRIRGLQADVQRSIIEIGFELLAAKKEVGHGGWADWLKKEFEWTQRTANNFMRMAERFGKFENIFHFQPSTLQAMLSLPEGDEEKFIAAQAEHGKPIKEMSAREVQSAVKVWNQQRKPKSEKIPRTSFFDENDEQEVRGEYVQITNAPTRAIVTAEGVEVQVASTAAELKKEIDVQFADAPAELHEKNLPPDVYTTIHEFIGAATLDDLKELRETLSKLAQEVESKIGELLKSTAGDDRGNDPL